MHPHFAQIAREITLLEIPRSALSDSGVREESDGGVGALDEPDRLLRGVGRLQARARGVAAHPALEATRKSGVRPD